MKDDAIWSAGIDYFALSFRDEIRNKKGKAFRENIDFYVKIKHLVK